MSSEKKLVSKPIELSTFKRPEKICVSSNNLFALQLMGRASVLIGELSGDCILKPREIILSFEPDEIFYINNRILMAFCLSLRKIVFIDVDLNLIVSEYTFDYQQIAFGCSEDTAYFLFSNDDQNYSLHCICEDTFTCVYQNNWVIPSIKITRFFVVKDALFFSSETNNSVFKTLKNNQKTEIIEFATYGRGNGYVRSPQDIQVWNNQLIVLDRDNYHCQFFDICSLMYLGQIGKKGTEDLSLDFAGGMFCADDLLYVADTNNDRVLEFDLNTNAAKVILSRDFEPGNLSRPVGIVANNSKLFVCDRDNSAVQVFDYNSRYLYHFFVGDPSLKLRPNSIKLVDKEGGQCLVVLIRRQSMDSAMLIMFDLVGNELAREPINDDGDPQGFVVTENGNIVVSDTLNRRALVFDRHLSYRHTVDLAALTHDRFLCRQPFLRNSDVGFGDYHGNQAVVFDSQLKSFRVEDISYRSFGIKHIRNLIFFEDGCFILGRGLNSLLYQNLQGKCYTLPAPMALLLAAPSDLCIIGSHVICLDKENDSMLRVLISDFNQVVGAGE